MASLKSRDAFALAALAAVVAVVLAPHAPAGVPVLVAALAALVAGFWPTAHSDPPPPHHWVDEQDRPDHPGDGRAIRPEDHA